jgi:hypothetical protein
MADAGIAQGHGAFEFHQRKAVGDIRQGPRRRQQAMPVGIGLDHAPDAGGAAWRRTTV